MSIFSTVFGAQPGIVAGISPGIALIIRHIMDNDGTLKDYSYEYRFNHLLWVLIFVGIWNMIAGAIRAP